MEALFLIGAFALIGGIIFLGVRSEQRKKSKREARWKALKSWKDEQCALAANPETPTSVLRGILTTPLQHDDSFNFHLEVLRALATNPSLSDEVAASTINRISQEENALRTNAVLAKTARQVPRTFIIWNP